MIATIRLSDEHTPQPIPPVNDDDDDDDDGVKPGSGGGNIDPDDDEGDDDDEDDEDETLWTDRDVQWQRMMGEWSICAIVGPARRSDSHEHQT
jgi:hypothetical protein